MAHKPTVTFRRTKPRLWLGNGFGYSAAEYAVVQDGIDIATISKSDHKWWKAWMDGERWLDAPTLADLKTVIREALNAG